MSRTTCMKQLNMTMCAWNPSLGAWRGSGGGSEGIEDKEIQALTLASQWSRIMCSRLSARPFPQIQCKAIDKDI